MKILSKKTGLPQEVSIDQWEQMKARGDHRKYKVEDATDDNLGTVEVVVVDPILMTFKEAEEVVDVAESPDQTIEEEKQWYKDELDAKGIPYQVNTGIKKLRKKYEESL